MNPKASVSETFDDVLTLMSWLCNQAAGRSMVILSRPIVTSSTSDLFALSRQSRSTKIPHVRAFLILQFINVMSELRIMFLHVHD